MFRARTQGLKVCVRFRSPKLVLEGWGNRGVAHKLGLKPAMINSYLIQVYRKLGVRNRTELAGYLSGASRSGIASKE
ncbi:MAG: LuxR C-terminal-related transcriptional regulator [Planctomycetota bacterium]